MDIERKSRIAELEKELNAKEFTPLKMADKLREHASEVKKVSSSWDQAEQAAILQSERERGAKHRRMAKKIFLVSVGFFVITGVIAAFSSWRGSNLVSGDNIRIDITAPILVSGGDPFETKVSIMNENNVRVDQADLFFEYPSGFYSATDKSDLPRISRNIGALDSDQSREEIINAIAYGEENTEKEVRVVLEYRMAGSSATLKKFATYTVKIASSPVNLKVGLIKEASSGQEIEFSIDVESNTEQSLSGLLLDVSYPSGFMFRSASPSPTYQNNIWDMGMLESRGKRTIKVRGVIEGQESEEKVVKVSLGTQSAKDERIIGVVYTSANESVLLTKPFLGLDLAVNGNRAPEHVISKGQSVRVDVFWVSNSAEPITNAVLEVKLKGDALNRFSVYASNGGFYQSVNDTIVWEKTGTPELAVIEPGAQGNMSFSFSVLPLSVETGKILKNSKITLEAKVRARQNANGGSEEVATFTNRTIKLETDVRLLARSLYYSGPFQNTGNLPPRADQQTTYTIMWTVRNASNNVSNAFVRTTLPIYVKWMGVIDPGAADIIYNESGAEVVWNVGRIPSGGSRDVAFQVAMTPSLSQLDTMPPLTGDSFLTAVDDFTKTELRDRKPAVTTNLSMDPQFTQNQGPVVR